MSNEESRHRLGHRLYPELGALASAAERRAVFQRAQRQLLASWPAWCVAGPLTLGVVWSVHAARVWALGHTQLPGWLIAAGLGAVLLAYVYGASTFLFVGRMRRHIRAALSARGVAVCLACGYDLRGLSGGRCPECGAPEPPGRPRAAP